MEQQLNYKEGDIIYRQGKTYICEMATNTKAIFKAMSIGLLIGTGPAHTMSCGNLGGPPCNDYFKIDLEAPEWRCKTERLSDGSITRATGKYPVIGHNGKCAQVFNMGSISRNYPDLYTTIIRNEAARLGILPPVNQEFLWTTDPHNFNPIVGKKQIPTPEPPAAVLPEKPKRGRPKKAAVKKAPKKGAKTSSKKYNANGLRRRGNY